jgi:DNA-binding MarR family transcriptional regulator
MRVKRSAGRFAERRSGEQELKARWRNLMPELLDLFGNASKVVRAVTDAALREHGLRLGQDHLLAALWRRDGQTPGEIAAALLVTTPAITKGATVLEKSGLLERRADDRDNRLVRLWLTEKGRALQGPVKEARVQVEERLTAALSGAEAEALAHGLEKLLAAGRDILAPRQEAIQREKA